MARDATAAPWVRLVPPRWRDRIDNATALALQAEFLGTLLFVFAAANVSSALAVGISYAVLSYATSPLSGGHLNPIVTLAQALSGHAHFATAGLYIVAQVLGGIAGSLLEGLLMPGVHIGHNKHVVPSGCFAVHDVGVIRLIVIEFVFSFLFLMVIYSCAVASPNNRFVPVAPLAAGLALYVAIEASGSVTGSPLNPARLIGPAIVFFCNWRHFWAWLAGEVLAAIAAAAYAAGSYGVGTAYAENRESVNRHVPGELGDRLMPEDNA